MNMFPDINVLLIEDDPMVQEVNRQFIERVAGFKVIDTAENGNKGFEKAINLKPHLIILDIYMPEKDGVEVMVEMRSKQLEADVLVITAANDKETIRTMLLNGAVDYVIKPFKFERIEQALKKYKQRFVHLSDKGEMTQNALDALLQLSQENNATVHPGEKVLPKGLNVQTLKQVIRFMGERKGPLSAEETADGVGIARVTARRYLEYLSQEGTVEIDVQYGGVGRPVNRYRLV
jgi:two-component system response regulator DctR